MYKRVLSNQLGHDMLGDNIYSSQKTIHLLLHNVSVIFKPDHPPGDPRDSHILVAPGVGFSLLCLARGGGTFNQKKSSTILKKRDFCLVTKTNE